MASITHQALALTLLASVVVLAAPTSAIYIQTPLAMDVPETAEAGDVVTITIRGYNESEAAPYAGATVRVVYAFDTNESGEGAGAPDEPVDDSTWQVQVLREAVALDDNATATFEWTVPQEVDARNVDLIVESQDGERLAFAYLAVGDAPPMMRILAGSGPGPIEPDTGSEVGEDSKAIEGEDQEDQQEGNGAPGIGAAAALAALGLLALARRRA